MSESVLVWEEFVGSERARIGALEFFATEMDSGAVLYTDSGSFDQSYGGTSHASVETAKIAAEEITRHTYDALVAHFAPVLRWHVLGDQCDASLGDWILLASTGLWVARHRSGPRITSDPSCTLDAEQARRAAEAVLRSLGVVFRTEGE